MDGDLSNNLEKSGLNEKQAKIYAYLLTSGGAYPSKIALGTNLNRSTTYKILTDLAIMGLINEIEKKNKLFYQVDKPEKLLKYAKDQIKISESFLRNTENLFPELQNIFNSLSKKPKVKYFEGKDTIQILCDETVSGKGNYEMLAISNAKKFRSFIPKDKLSEYVKSKERLNIKTRAIVPETVEDRNYVPEVFKNINKKVWPNVRYAPEKMMSFEGEITLFETNKVSITKLGEKDLIGILIEDKSIYEMIKALFEVAWESKLLKK